MMSERLCFGRASRAVVSYAMTMSPRNGRPSARGAAAPAAAGNDSTLVGSSSPRHSRLSFRIAASSVSTTRLARARCGKPPPRSYGLAARWRRASGSSFHSARLAANDRAFDDRHARSSALRAARLIPRPRACARAAPRPVIGLDDARHEFVADDVLGGEHHMRDAFDTGQQATSPRQARRSGRAADRPGSDRR